MVSYLYAAMWLVIALFLFFVAFREKRLFVALGGVFFLFFSGWTVAGIVTGVDMFSGTLGWIFRGAAIAALALFGLFYFISKRKQ